MVESSTIASYNWVSAALDHDSPDYDLYLTEPILRQFKAPLTPPPSHSPTPNTIVSVSTSFYPGSDPMGCNLIFSSSDSVLFYVHTDVLLERSKNAFHMLLPQLFTKFGSDPPIVAIGETSIVLDVIIHIMYGTPCSTHTPSFPSVVAAVDHMPIYDIDPKDHLVPSNVNYGYILLFAPLFPLELYTLAAHHNLIELATATSSHLLSHPLSTIDDETAVRMGPIYLKRLLCLHKNRSTALKDILLVPPHPHPPTKNCSFSDQRYILRAWALVAAYLAWDARPDISTSSIKNAFATLDGQISCPDCQRQVHDRLRDVVTRWACINHAI